MRNQYRFLFSALLAVSGCTVRITNEIEAPVYVDVPEGAVTVENTTVVQAGENLPELPECVGDCAGHSDADGESGEAMAAEPVTTAEPRDEPADEPVTPTEPPPPASPIVITVDRTTAFHHAADKVVERGTQNVNVRTFLLRTDRGTAILEKFVARLGANTDGAMVSECRIHAWPSTDDCTSAAVPDAAGIMEFFLDGTCLVESGVSLPLDMDCDIREDAYIGIILDPWFEQDGGNYAADVDGVAPVSFAAAPYQRLPWTYVVEPPPVVIGFLGLSSSSLHLDENAVARFVVTATERDVTLTGLDFGVQTWNDDGGPAGVEVQESGDSGHGSCVRDITMIGRLAGSCFGTDSLLPDFTGLSVYRTYLTQGVTIAAGTSKIFDIVVWVGGQGRFGDFLSARGPKMMLDGRWYDTPTGSYDIFW